MPGGIMRIYSLVLLILWFVKINIGTLRNDRVGLSGVPEIELINKTGKRVQAEEDKDHQGRIRRQDKEQNHGGDQNPERHAFAVMEALAGIEWRIADHGKTCINRNNHGKPRQPVTVHRHSLIHSEPDKTCDQRSGRRRRQSLEEALIHYADVRVKARKTKRCARAVHKRRGPAESSEIVKRPLINHHRRRHTERAHIGERVKLLAK